MYGFYIVFIWFYVVLYMVFEMFHIFWKLILRTFYHILRKSQGSFCESSGPKFALLCKIDFVRFLYLPEHFLISDLIDFLLLLPWESCISSRNHAYFPRNTYSSRNHAYFHRNDAYFSRSHAYFSRNHVYFAEVMHIFLNSCIFLRNHAYVYSQSIYINI